MRVLRCVIERSKRAGQAEETPIGYVPKASSLNGADFNVPQADLNQLLTIDREGWKQNLKSQGEYFDKFGDHLPAGIRDEHKALAARLKA